MADPTGAPKGKVKKFSAPKRSGVTRQWVSNFRIPANHTKSDNKRRATNLDVWWYVKLKGGSDLISKRDNRPKGTTESTCDLNNLSAGGKSYTRESFYPYVASRKVSRLVVKVRERNNKGGGPWDTKESAKLLAPKVPTISALTLNNSNGRVSFIITSEAGEGVRERAYTRYVVKVYRSATKKETPYYEVHSGTGSSVDGKVLKNSRTEISDYYDVPDWQSVSTKDYITVTVEAWNTGLAGDSEHKTRSLTLAFPAKATIGNIECAGTGNDSKATVYANTNATSSHPVTLCRLEVLANTDYQKASDIPAGEESNWEAVGATDDANLKAFATTVGQLRPDKGKRTWLRVITINQSESPYRTVSEYKAVTDLEVPLPTAADDKVMVQPPIPRPDGTSADVTILWDEDTPNTGTEITYSQDPEAWESNQPPTPFEFTWQSSDTPPTGWTGMATIKLLGLTEGAVTYIRARRYYEDADGDRTWTQYSEPEQVMPVTSPNSVTLSLTPFVPRGTDIEAVWTYDTDAAQTSWQLFEMLGQTPDIETDRVIDGGTDAKGSVVFSSERLSADTAMLYVSMSTGGAAVQSDVQKVSIVDPPTCTVSVATLTAKPLEITVGSNVETGSLTVIVTADGTNGDGFGPEQMAGDTVWSTSIQNAEWGAVTGGYQTVVPVPADQSLLYDKASYTVQVRVMDGATGLWSEVAETDFAVDWQNKAPQLVDDSGYLADVTISPSDVTDTDGIRTRSCAVQLAAPDGMDPTVVMDVYRVGRDGMQTVAEGVDSTALVTDPYAPFGGTDLAYRVVTRTTDGDTAWADFPYEFGTQEATDSLQMRIDYGEDYVECHRGVAPSDQWSKDFNAFSGIDGTITGAWNEGVKRTSSASPAFVRVYEEAQQQAMEELAQYVGPCFVRVSDGSAYEADVQVTGRSRSLGSAGVVYSLSITQLDPSGQYVGVVS